MQSDEFQNFIEKKTKKNLNPNSFSKPVQGQALGPSELTDSYYSIIEKNGHINSIIKEIEKNLIKFIPLHKDDELFLKVHILMNEIGDKLYDILDETQQLEKLVSYGSVRHEFH